MAKVLNQDDLLNVLKKLFRGHNILVNSRKNAKVTNLSTGYFLEVDLYIPDLKIGFEFQDSYHYSYAWYSNVHLDSVRHKDTAKKTEIENRGDTLVSIPCWWDGTPDSLVATIRTRRLDLLQELDVKAAPISLVPPLNYFSGETGVPGVGELMLASFPVAHEFLSTFSANAWWLGEKYDGLRCCWNSDTQKLYGRRGVEIKLPVQDDYLACYVDGELWMGRGTYLDLNFGIPDPSLRVIAFEDPEPTHHTFPFEDRYASLLLHIPPEHNIFIIPTRVLCTSHKQLSQAINMITTDEGEGLILNKPKSLYEPGRSTALLKLKTYRADKEALVTHTGGDGICHLKLPSGVIFEATNPIKGKPARGDIVTFSYQHNFGSATSPLPKIERIRTDMSWADVIREDATRDRTEYPKFQILNTRSSEVVETQPISTRANVSWIREFFERIAKRKRQDPLRPQTWYTINKSYVHEKKKYKSVLSLFGNNMIKALLYVFPDIGLDPSKFRSFPPNYWVSVENRRNYFDNIALQRNSNTLSPNTWYDISPKEIFNKKGGSTLMALYGDSYIRAVTHLYPEIGLDELLFPHATRSYWKNIEHQKEAFDSFALQHAFDPLIADNWLNFNANKASSHKGIAPTIAHYEGNFMHALRAIYPNSMKGSEYSKSIVVENNASESSRKLLCHFADEQGFDPLVPANWFSVRRSQIANFKQGNRVLSTFNNNLYKTLLYSFPDIGFDRIDEQQFTSKFLCRKLFLERFAKEKGFDPLVPQNWYTVCKVDFIHSKEQGAYAFLNHYKSVAEGIVDIFPNIGLEKDKFISTNQYWAYSKNRRAFFVHLAKCKQFDPLIPENWYSVTTSEIFRFSDATNVMKYHNGNCATALLELFPDIGLDKSKFATLAAKYWSANANQRWVFEQFSVDHKFDPLVYENWSNIHVNQLKQNKDVRHVLSYYEGDITKAVRHLFPGGFANIKSRLLP